jgi:seryl-tRNA synthetase
MGVSQQPSEEEKKEIEFYEILKKANATQEANRTFIKTVDEKTGKIIDVASKNIVSLKNEVKQLKTELNETNKKLDSINSNTGAKFSFSAISNNEKDR